MSSILGDSFRAYTLQLIDGLNLIFFLFKMCALSHMLEYTTRLLKSVQNTGIIHLPTL